LDVAVLGVNSGEREVERMQAKEVLRRHVEGEREFKRLKLRGANFKGANLVGAIFDGCDLCGANYFRATLTEARLGARLPWLKGRFSLG